MKIQIVVVDNDTQYNFNGIMRLILAAATKQSISMEAGANNSAFIYLVSFEGIDARGLQTLTTLVKGFDYHTSIVE